MGIIDNFKRKLGEYFVNKARENMKKRSYGRRYFYRGRIHIASKPYQPPNIMSGALYNTVKYKIRGNTIIISEGSSSVDYAHYLELGTRKMAPRPNLFDMFKKEKKAIDNIYNKELISKLNRKFRNVRNIKI